MKLEEFTHIVETYGTETRQWPSHLRTACLEFMADNKDASALLDQHRDLDQFLDQLAVPEFPGLESRVLKQQLPAQTGSPLELLVAWLLPQGTGTRLWRPALAACLPLVFGIMVGNYYSFGINGEDELYWDDELTLLSFNDYSESQF